MNYPDQLHYADTHEWAVISDQAEAVIITGVTEYAQDSLGDLMFVELPEVGKHFQQGEQIGVLESVKTASDIHAPISGVVIEVNEALRDSPELINESPYEQGWIYKLKADQIADLDSLLTAEAYEKGL